MEFGSDGEIDVGERHRVGLQMFKRVRIIQFLYVLDDQFIHRFQSSRNDS